jgi:hypothetical protein
LSEIDEYINKANDKLSCVCTFLIGDDELLSVELVSAA